MEIEVKKTEDKIEIITVSATITIKKSNPWFDMYHEMTDEELISYFTNTDKKSKDEKDI